MHWIPSPRHPLQHAHLDALDTRSKANTFYSILTEQIDKHLPTRRVRVSPTDKLWMTTKIKENFLQRDSLLLGKANNTFGKHYRNSVIKAILTSKTTFAKTKLSHANKRSASWFKTAKVLTGMHAQKHTTNIPGTRRLSTRWHYQ